MLAVLWGVIIITFKNFASTKLKKFKFSTSHFSLQSLAWYCRWEPPEFWLW